DEELSSAVRSCQSEPRSIAFFFQAEDGIRDGHVTGVQTCALPISFEKTWDHFLMPRPFSRTVILFAPPIYVPADATADAMEAKRSEERRVGKECRTRRWTEH